MGSSAPHLAIYTSLLLLLLYGYEIFNFSLSVDEEIYTHRNAFWASIAQGRWGLGIISGIFPPIGNIPTISTVLFCAGLGVSACLLARTLFRSHPAQYAFAGLFVSSPLWPHIAEFNSISWGVGVGCVLLTLSLLLVLSDKLTNLILAVGLLAFAIGIYQSFFAWFLVLLCVRYLSVVLGAGPTGIPDAHKKFPWIRGGLVATGGLLGYVVIEKLLLAICSLQLGYVQDFIRLSEFKRVPVYALKYTFHRSWDLLFGADPIYLGYGRILTFLSLLGFLIAIVRLLRSKLLTNGQRLWSGAVLAAAVAFALSPIVIAAGAIPPRALITWIPLGAFLGGLTLTSGGRFTKPLYCVLAAALFVSIWVSVSLFYGDHVARQRDEILTARIMARVDQLVPNQKKQRIPFVVVPPGPEAPVPGVQKIEIFGSSFYGHGGGDPQRIVAYLRILGIDTLEPGNVAGLEQQRATVEAMPLWPDAGSVAMINGILVIKLGPVPEPPRP